MPAKIATLLDVLDEAKPRPPNNAPSTDKKNYAQRFSQHASTMFANALRPAFDGILPCADGSRQESKARTAKGFKKLDVNYSTPELGLGLGVSIKTLNYRDQKTNRYTKNYTRIDNELRAEAMDYHVRQPWAVMVAVVYLPIDACDDGNHDHHSSFGGAVRTFRHRAGRILPEQDAELFESIYIGLYHHSGNGRGKAQYFDVMNPPPKRGRPAASATLSFDQLLESIIRVYDRRNNPEFEWA